MVETTDSVKLRAAELSALRWVLGEDWDELFT
jgi:hypothetical protein